jgi:hypothetical protein
MGSLNLPLSMQVTPSEIFAEMPVGFRSFLNRGFADLASLPFEKIERLSKVLADGVEQVDDGAATECARLLGVPTQEVSKITAALSLMIAFTTRRTDVEAVLQQGAQAGVISPEDVPALIDVAGRLAEKKSEYKEALEIVSLAKEVAPSFERLSLATEVRVSFENDAPVRSVPLILCRLKTDLDGEDLLFQMRRKDVVQVVEQLTKALQHVDILQEQINLQKRDSI